MSAHMVIRLKMATKTNLKDKIHKVGNRRSQVGNIGRRRVETKELKSLVEITHSQNVKRKNLKIMPPL